MQIPENSDVVGWLWWALTGAGAIISIFAGLYHNRLLSTITEQKKEIEIKDSTISNFAELEKLRSENADLLAALKVEQKKELARQELLVNELVNLKDLAKLTIEFLQTTEKNGTH